MLLASLAIALLTGPQLAPPADDGVGKVWENLDVMRRMLVRQVGARHDQISAAPRKSDDGEVTKEKEGRGQSAPRSTNEGAGDSAPVENLPGRTGIDTVAGTFLRNRSANWWADGSVASDAEYVPGLAAIFSLSVPVKVRIVTLEPKKDEAKKPAETKNADDEAWERLAHGGDDPVDRHVNTLLGQGGKGQDEPRREIKFDDAAVKALKETVVDTVARFGGRVGLGHGERLAVVVKFLPGSVVDDGEGGAGGKKGDGAVGTVLGNDPNTYVDVFGRGANAYPNSYDSFFLNARIASPGRRFVLQVSADDLRAFKGGDLERDELLRKMRLEEFTLPATANAAGNRFTWSSNLAK